MKRGSRKRVVGRLVSLGVAGGALLSGCAAYVNVPGTRVDVSPAGVFVDVLGAIVRVTDDLVHIDVPRLDIDIGHEGHPHR